MEKSGNALNDTRRNPATGEGRFQTFLYVGILFALSLVLRLLVLFDSPFAHGADGYYYAAQIKYLLTKGYFFSPDASPLLYLMAGMARLTGDIITGNKILIALLGAALVFPGYLLGRGRDRSLQRGLLTGALLVAGSIGAHFTFDYVKNLAGILVFLFFLVPLKGVLDEGLSRRRAAAAALLFTLAFLTHKLMAGLAGLALAGSLVWLFRARWRLLLAAAGVLALSVLAAGQLLPGVLARADFSRLGGLFSLLPQLAPLSFAALFPSSALLSLELVVYTLLPPLAAAVLWRRRALRPWHWIPLGLWLAALFPFFRFADDNLAFRLFLLVFIPAALLVPELVRFRFEFRLRPLLLWGCLLLTLLWQGAGLIRTSRLPGHDYALYRDLLPLIELPRDHLLIVHLGFDYFYCFHDKGDAFHFLPEKKHETRPVWRLAHGVSEQLMRQTGLDSREVRYLPGGYTLLREERWQTLLRKLPAAERNRLRNWKNPHTLRPGYMREADRFLPR